MIYYFINKYSKMKVFPECVHLHKFKSWWNLRRHLSVRGHGSGKDTCILSDPSWRGHVVPRSDTPPQWESGGTREKKISNNKNISVSLILAGLKLTDRLKVCVGSPNLSYLNLPRKVRSPARVFIPWGSRSQLQYS